MLDDYDYNSQDQTSIWSQVSEFSYFCIWAKDFETWKKLIQNVLPALAVADSLQDVEEWQQPNYFDALRAVRTRSGENWGHPVGIRAAADHNLCPALALPAGVASIACNFATCMSVCEPGKIAVGQRRTKCRFNRRNGFFWKRVTKLRIYHFRNNTLATIGVPGLWSSWSSGQWSKR